MEDSVAKQLHMTPLNTSKNTIKQTDKHTF